MDMLAHWHISRSTREKMLKHVGVPVSGMGDQTGAADNATAGQSGDNGYGGLPQVYFAS